MRPASHRLNPPRSAAPPPHGNPGAPGITCEIDRHSPEDWARLVCGFADATCDQTFAMRAERWGHEKLSTIVLSRDGEPLACAILVLLTVPVLGKGFAYLKMGPLWRRRGHAADPQNLRLILDAIRREYSLRRGLLVMALLPPDPDTLEAAGKVMLEQDFKYQHNRMDPNRYLVNVQLDEEAQLQSLQQKWRYNLRKSLKNELDITAHESEEALSEFIALYSAMVARKELPTKTPAATLADLIRELPGDRKPKIVIVRHDGRPTAGAVIGNLGAMASFIYGATDNRALPLKAGYAMQWWIVNWLGGLEDVNWYDLGGDGDEPGLRQFKKGLIGKAGALVESAREFETWNDPVSWLITESTTATRLLSRNLRKFDLSRFRDWFKP